MIDYSAATALAIGGVAGTAIGAAIVAVFRIKNVLVRKYLVMFCAAFLMVVLPKTAFKNYLDRQVFKKSRFEMTMTALGTALVKEPDLKEKTESIPPAKIGNFVAQKQHEGMFWLDLANLDRWSALRLKMAQLSPQVCVSFLKGNASNEQLTDVFEKLTDQDAKDWLDISVRSLKAAVGGKVTDKKIVETEFEKYIPEVIQQGDAADADKFADLLGTYPTKSDEDVCWLVKKIHENAAKLPPDHRLSFLRALASY